MKFKSLPVFISLLSNSSCRARWDSLSRRCWRFK